jgi:hypothetical protein
LLLDDIAIFIASISFMSFLIGADKPLGPWARVGTVVMIVSLYAFILVPEQARIIAFYAEVVGSIGIALNRWDGTLPKLARKPRP